MFFKETSTAVVFYETKTYEMMTSFYLVSKSSKICGHVNATQ